MAIKTAILGYGRSGSTLHADAIEKSDQFEMTAICDIDKDAQKKATQRFGCKVYHDYHKMLEKEKLDLVVIVTRSHQHCKMACDCLKAGKNILVTKPYAINVNEAKEMIKTSHECNKMFLPWLPARWGCDLLALKDVISTGVIGKVFQVRRSEFTFGIRHDWQTQRKCGGGYLLNWGPHLVDQPVQLIGEKVKTVFGDLKQVLNPGDVEDVFYSVMKTENNVTLVSEFNIGASYLPNWVVQGDRGTIFVKEKHMEIHKAKFPDTFDPLSYRNKVEIEILDNNIEGTHRITMGNRYGDSSEIYAHIADVVLGKEKYAITHESALELMKELEAIKKSSELNKLININ